MNSIKNNNFFMAIFLSFILIVIFFFISVLYTEYLNNCIYYVNSNNKNYSLNIKYKLTNNNEIDDKVRRFITNDKKKFLNDVGNKYYSKYELLSSNKKYKNIYFTNISIKKSINNKNSYKTISYIYDKNNKYYKIHDFINNNTSYNLLKKRVGKDFNNFYFNKKGLVLIFDNNEEVIPWADINSFIKKKYRPRKDLLVPSVRDIESLKDKKLLCFTFDDGPRSKTTSILLDNLDKYNARVTFFTLGMRIEDNKDVLKRAYLMGDDIGSHTYSHKDLTDLKDKKLLEEVNNTNDKINKILGVTPKYIRPPYGSVNNHVKKLYNMKTILWNVDSLDWKLKNRNKIKDEIVKHAKNGNIILVHDIYEESVYGALMAMEELKKDGYNFVTISEMAYLKNIELNTEKTYFGF